MKKKVKKILIILIICLITIVGIMLLIIKYNNDKTTFDLIEVSNRLIKYYGDDDLEIKETNYANDYGLPVAENDSVLAFANFDINNYNYKDDKNPLIVVMVSDLDKKDVKKYYQILTEYKEAMIYRESDKRLNKLFKKMVIEKGYNYVYFVISDNSSVVANEINELKK